MFNTRLLTYDITLREAVLDVVQNFEYKDKETLAVIVSNLISGISKGVTLVYSRNTSLKADISMRKINTKKIIKAVDFLEQEGYVENKVGTPSKNPEFRTVSTLTPTEKFMQKFLTMEDIKQIEQDYIDAVQGVVLRDANKVAMNYISDDEVQKMKENVLKLNTLNEKATILMKDGTRLSNVYSRIFNESFAYGGRFYRADILQLHHKDGQQRLDVTVNGEPVVEIDYQNLHFRIAAVLENLDMEEIPMDMYAAILDDPSNKVERGIVKLAVNIMFNCKNTDSAKRAIQGEINSLSPEDKLQYNLGSARSVMALIEMNYPDFTHMFCAEESFGRVLQNLDSHLASDVLEVFVEKEIPVLCVHDSFICAREHAQLLAVTMAEKFRQRFKVQCEVPMSLQWKDSKGEVQEKKVAL